MYDQMTDDELARCLASRTELSEESALRLVQSNDSYLGRSRAVALLEAQDRKLDQRDEMTRSRERLRVAARS
jgi:hypothetical protein